MELTALYQQYGKDKVDAAIAYLSYSHVEDLPKYENPDFPILYIFRHGQSTDNADFLFSGWRDVGITKKGEEQALELAPKLKTKKIDLLISSPQLRATQTMKLALSLNNYASSLKIETDDRIKERHYGDYQGTSKLIMQLESPEKLLQIRRDYYAVPPHGESLEMVCTRVEAFCVEIVPLMKQNKINVAISCHGNSIRGFRKYFEHLTPDQTAEIETPLGKDYAAYSID